jgi:uncharacterized protein YyaL (SSP411 family)
MRVRSLLLAMLVSACGSPADKGEGAFYLWTAAEVREIAGEPAAGWFALRYGIREGGNAEHDPQGEFTGRNIAAVSCAVSSQTVSFGR